jgi:hypothetical protein
MCASSKCNKVSVFVMFADFSIPRRASHEGCMRDKTNDQAISVLSF